MAVADRPAEHMRAASGQVSSNWGGASEGEVSLCCRDTVIASNPLAPVPANSAAKGKNAAKIPSPYSGVPLLPMRVKPAVNASWVDVDTPNRATCEVSWSPALTSHGLNQAFATGDILERASKLLEKRQGPACGCQYYHSSGAAAAAACALSFAEWTQRLTSLGVGMRSPR